VSLPSFRPPLYVFWNFRHFTLFSDGRKAHTISNRQKPHKYDFSLSQIAKNRTNAIFRYLKSTRGRTNAIFRDLKSPKAAQMRFFAISNRQRPHKCDFSLSQIAKGRTNAVFRYLKSPKAAQMRFFAISNRQRPHKYDFCHLRWQVGGEVENKGLLCREGLV
jgi:hypothetical protein